MTFDFKSFSGDIPGLDAIPGSAQNEDTGKNLELTGFDGKIFVVPESHVYGNCRRLIEFEKLGRIGEGAFGIVYKARDKKTNDFVALKKLKLSDHAKGISQHCIREISNLKGLRHENIVNLNDIVVARAIETVHLVMEFCEYDLSNVIDAGPINGDKVFKSQEIKFIMQQLFSGLQYIHSNFIIHRDIKVANILFTAEGCLKIADFGLSRKITSKPMSPEVVTRWYRAPEILFLAKDYTTAIDIWSAGCIFAELLLNRPFFPGNTDLDMITMIIECLGTPNDHIWPGCSVLPVMQTYNIKHQPYNNLKYSFRSETVSCVELLHRLFLYDPKKRISATDCLALSYFTEEPACSLPHEFALRLKASKA